MIGIILTAGNGERLGKVKACRSKCMLPVNGGTPLLKYKFEMYRQCPGIERIYVVIHTDETEIQDYFGTFYEGIPVVYCIQSPQNKGIIGGLYAVNSREDLFQQDILLMLGDEYIENADIKSFVEFYDFYRNSICAIAVPTNDLNKIKKNYSIELGSDMVILNAVEKPELPFNNLIGTGVLAIPGTILKEFYDRVYMGMKNELQLVDLFYFAQEQGKHSYAYLCHTNYCNVNNAEDLYALSNPYKSIQDFDNIAEVFYLCAKRNPDKIAVVCNDRTITYQELYESSGIVCEQLMASGCKPGSCIALMCSREISHIVSFLAVLKAGCFYLPLDETLPMERLFYMVEKSKAEFIIVTEALHNELPFPIPILLYENLIQPKSNNDINCMHSERTSNSEAAYVMFTSGSTGKPKGAVIKQQAVLNLTRAMQEEVFNRFHKDTIDIGVMASFSFDLSVQQIFPALLLGHTLHIIPKDIKARPAALVQQLNKLDVCDGTPLIMDMLNQYLKHNLEVKLTLKHYMSAGEELKKDTIHNFFKICPEIFVTNCYGPTECTVETTLFFLNKEIEEKYPVIPIGKPIQNTLVYILDENKRLVAPGVTGEIWISGVGVGLGYINDELLTKAAFVEDILNSSQKMYKTGDLGYWGKDSCLYYKGRIDNQIKYKGYRIETSEIEKTIEDFDGIRFCRVFLMEDFNTGTISDKKLVAYYIANGEPVIYEQLVNYIEKKLPDYMLPQFFVPVNSYPLNNNGKIDKAQLPDYKVHSLKYHTEALSITTQLATETDYVKLCKCAEEISHMSVLPDRSLILLGFDSLMSYALLAEIESEFQIKIDNDEWHLRLNLCEIYQLVKKKLTLLKENKHIKSTEPFLPKNKNRIMNALPMQKYLIKLEQINKAEGFFQLFNEMIYYIPIQKGIDISRLNKAFVKVQKKYDALQMNFQENGNHLRINLSDTQVQNIKICPNSYVSDAFHSISIGSELNTETIQSINADFDRTGWNHPPHIKMLYYKGKTNDLLALAIHHTVFDYLSLMYFMRDLELFYKKSDISLDSVIRQNHFSEYIKKQNQYLLSDDMRKEAELWKKSLKAAELPNWKKIIANMSGTHKYRHLFVKNESLQYTTQINFCNCAYKLGPDFSEELRSFCRAMEVGEFTVLFTLLLKILHRQEEVQNPSLLFFTSGRSRVMPVDTIGYFSYLIAFISGSIDFNNDFCKLIHEIEYNLKVLRSNENGFLDNNSRSQEIRDKILCGSAIFDYQKLYNFKKNSLWNYIYPFECVGVYNPFSLRIFDYGKYLEISVLYNLNYLSFENITALIESYLNEWKQNIVIARIKEDVMQISLDPC